MHTVYTFCMIGKIQYHCKAKVNWGPQNGWIKLLGESNQMQMKSLEWRHNGRDSVSNHQPHDCSLNRLFRRRSKKPSKLRVTGLCAGNSPGTGEFPAQRASNAENVSIWWRHHVARRMQYSQFQMSDLFPYNARRISVTYTKHNYLYVLIITVNA